MPHSLILSSIFFLLTLQGLAQDDPGVRNAHSMVYHAGEKAVYLFGGADDRAVLSDLWKWQRGQWSMVAKDGPEGRTFACMAYDPARQRIILFGGSRVLFGEGPDLDNLLNDTWSFKEGEWIEVRGAASPSKRAEAAAVYDTLRDRMVLFGGYEIVEGQYVAVGDTWELDGDRWERVSETGPSPRHNPAMAYDTRQHQVVLFGGSSGRSGYGEGKGETWTWDGQQWQKLTITQPKNIYNASMAFTDEGLLRYGGWDGQKRQMDLFVLKSEGWQLIETNPPPHHRNHTQMVFEDHERRAILYGGHDGSTVFGDLWSYQSGQWTRLNQTRPKSRVRNGH